MIAAADEQLHAPRPESAWQESYYFNWADLEGRYFGLARIGFNPHAGRVDGALFTVRDGRLEYLYPGVGLPYDAQATHSAEFGIRAGALSFSMREPLKRWNIHLSGRNEIDLTWTALSAPYDYHDGPTTYGSAAGEPVAANHFEQPGTVTGRIRVGAAQYDIEGFGQRDKSWGVREWGAISGWEWVTASFGPHFGFNATLLHGATATPTGFVHRGGVNRPLTAVQIDYEWTRTPQVPRAARLVLTDVDGETYVVRASALAQVPLAKQGLLIQETPARFETSIDGVRHAGVGVMEHAWHAGWRGTLQRIPDLVPVLANALKGKVR
ncbi:hypothetical protein [Mycolicibacterium sp. 624]|uniref:DUF7064 domain-containing protein n=1 Tax=Mycolicibacterium sp. 624 TaxID=3156314 RepID=UPI003394C6B5